MFKNLKEKIKEENNLKEIPDIPARKTSFARRSSSRQDSINSFNSLDELSVLEQKDAEISALRIQVLDFQKKFQGIVELEKANNLLEESMRVSQVQKDIFCDESEKIQNLQSQEISKLKSLLLFREQEAVDRLSVQKNHLLQIENLKAELTRIKDIENRFEDVKDELENLRHGSQVEKNSLKTQLNALTEENRQIKTKLNILEESRAIITNLSTGGDNDKIQLLVQEKKLLEQRLEEAHMHLFDVKSTWSNQNLSLETQLSRLSRQVSEETNEKRRTKEICNELREKLKVLEFDLMKSADELRQRDNKIKLLGEEIDELSTSLKDLRLENEEETTFLQNKVELQASELTALRERLNEDDIKLTNTIDTYEKQLHYVKKEVENLEKDNQDLDNELNIQRQQTKSLQLKNTEISQSEESLKMQLLQEQEEFNELNEKLKEFENEMNSRLTKINELSEKMSEIEDLKISNADLLLQIDRLSNDVVDKNKGIKILNQRLIDIKKTLHEEIKQSSSGANGSLSSAGPAILTPTNYDNNNCLSPQTLAMNTRKLSPSIQGGPVVMDEVNFRYLKHVILKFLTSRELEAKHLVKAVSTLLYLTNDEEKLIFDTLNWRMSWFGINKPGFPSS